ncbi:MAG TPA: bifunctional DNA primase/polymerase [Terriglobales bacterium]|nr:bifunctional DNA primase/polymerase [Terriglobales bacterium]
MSGAFAEWQPAYAERGIATFPVRDKRPCVRGWQCVGLIASAELAMKFPDADAFGFQCGRRSGISLLDIDSSDTNVIDLAVKTFGKSPVLWRTGSGNYAMPFCWSGERRRIRPIAGLPIDVLGSGYAVAPPSLGKKGRYEFLEGDLQNLINLPKLHIPANENQPRQGDKIPVGKRSDTLFRIALDQARLVDDLDALIDVVRTRNMDCEQPLSDLEVIKTASSAWGYEVRGENLIGRGGAMVISHSVIDALIDNPDAWRLYGKLRRRHWGQNFILASAMASSMGWGERRWKDARRCLEEGGLINCLHRGGRGPHDPPVYSWAQKGVLR